MKNNLYFRQLKISFYRGGNELIYYLSKFPFIKKFVKDSWYANNDLKLVLSVIQKIKSLIVWFIIGILSLFITLCFPVMIFDSASDVKDNMSVLFHIVFWVYCIMGAFAHRTIAIKSTDRNEYIMLHVMHTPAREYYMMKLCIRLLRTFADFLPIIFFGGFKAYLICCGYILCFRCIGEAFDLFKYTKWPDKAGLHELAGIAELLLGIGVGEVMCILKLGNVHTYSVMTSVPGIILTLAAAVVSLIYLVKYRKYRMIAHEMVTYEEVSAREQIRTNKSAALKDNITMNTSDEKSFESTRRKFENKKGYEYLTALFFSRHRHLFVKKMLIKSAVLLAAEILLFIFTLFIPGFLRTDDFTRILSVAPVMMYWLFIFSSGQSICQALFYNCDRPMLKYGYYRRSSAVLENFRFRIRYVMITDMIPTVVFCIMPFELMMINHCSEYLLTVVIVSLGFIAASVFFSVFHTMMYYLFQPYTEDMTVHGKAYKIINTIMIIAMYVLYMSANAGWTENGIRIFFGIFAAFSILFIPVSFLLVYRIAPKSFTLK